MRAIACVFFILGVLWSNSFNQLTHIQVTPTPDHKGVLLELLFQEALHQVPKISPTQTITLANIAPFAPRYEHFSSTILNQLEVHNQNNTLYIVPKSNALFKVNAKLSQDKRFLRLEFVPLFAALTPALLATQTQVQTQTQPKVTQTTQPQATPTAKPLPVFNKLLDFEWEYLWKVGVVIVGLLLILWILKRKGTQKFLFPKVGLEPSITYVKPLDSTHKLITIEVRNQLYLILLNSHQSLVLDKITLDFPKKDPSLRQKEALVEETKKHLRQSKLKSSYV
ncbi:hypothetical protein HHE02_12970 [Helicobacter heilmannii]|uniref:hypothetical protein n=1 Tax=Helicobacter heilmannii TaxID=35817 RepID=UPI00028AC5F1|nr:hypothetical protein [Helicobacter heilmannii]CCM12184.1 hypothetical protein BN341_4510 [Helicobacter heilmannii ASB1.4]CRF47995.1 hypothetical protein HHE02_12970 [Helicobacter heilmannii]CRF48855.1 hypothetical protein HHE03_04390 [Helicobacter heilmannii]CRF50299.1 hypothetical protein HHE06_01200 [Helicobacter heilmannii]BDQ27242.1 hypothetical protein ASB1_09180 [Helicobacter heilmannii]